MLLSQSNDLRANVLRLQIDSDHHIQLTVLCYKAQNFLDGGHLFTCKLRIEPGSSVQFADLVQRKVRNLAGAVRGSVDSTVMNAYELAVLGPLDVELETEPKFEAGSKVRKGLLRCVTQQTAVTRLAEFTCWPRQHWRPR